MSGDSDMEYSSDNECEYDDYYNIGVPDVDVEQIDRRKSDPEFLEYTCLDMEAVEKLLNETVEQLSNIIKVTPWLAKVLLLEHKWNIGDVREKYRIHALGVMIRARIIPAVNAAVAPTGGGGGQAGPGSAAYKFRTVDPALEIAAANGLSRFALHAHKVDWPPGPNNLSWLIGTKPVTPASASISPTTAAAAAALLSLSTSSTSPASKSTIGPSITSVAAAATSTDSSVSSSALAALAIPTFPSSPSPASARTSPSGCVAPIGVVPNICCPVCICPQPPDQFYQLYCAHAFCRDCWTMHFETQIQLGVTTAMGCMATRCNIRVPEELVLALLAKPQMRDKYQQFAFLDYVKSHPNLRFCPGPNCQTIVQSADAAPKKATCSVCSTSFCYRCGTDYHAPTDCRVIRRWLTKCADDSETANYISAHTKDCPKCHICIEKNGGCNHMQCFNCKHDFCWMCVGDWKTHGSEYYECSRYKENPNIANESVHVQAREALKKYLHYYERWENHSKSLQLEQQTLDRLKSRINKKVMKGLGTWIDWQHLFNAAALLARCRYTLQYTYPYAYFMEAGSRKDLFEYQQAQLEAEIENLSWKIERAETTDRGDLENQMDVAEKRRVTLIKDFFLIDV